MLTLTDLQAIVAALRAVRDAGAESALYSGPVESMRITRDALRDALTMWESTLAHLLDTGTGQSVPANRDSLWLLESALEWARRSARDNGADQSARRFLNVQNSLRTIGAKT